METSTYPKRLIEVDLPIARISAHARREKSIRHGHISTLHIWWARRPLAACRAVICASLWPDPVDLTAWAERGEAISVGDGSVIIRPRRFLDTARERMTAWAKEHLGKVSKESYSRFVAIQNGAKTLADPLDLQRVLLDFIADFANWNNSTDKDYLETARALTQSAHEALGGEPGTRPLVVDPFAGGGSIPLEALRVGADVFASDLNPVAVLLNKVVLEYIPKYGQRLADEVRKWGTWIKQEAEKELAEFYPKDPDGATPIAYLWARTIQCEGPGCGAEVPMLRSFVLSRSKGNPASIAIKYENNSVTPNIQISKSIAVESGTNKRSSATCPKCGYTTPRERLAQQSQQGLFSETLLVVVKRDASGKKFYSSPTNKHLEAFDLAKMRIEQLEKHNPTRYIIAEDLPYLRSIFNVHVYSMNTWGKLFNPRQRLSLFTFADLVAFELPKQLKAAGLDNSMAQAIETLLAFCIDRIADYSSSICRWDLDQQRTINTFCRQALGMVWDYAENVPYAWTVGSWDSMLDSIIDVVESTNRACLTVQGFAMQSSATGTYLPDDSAQCYFTDPPYYDAIPYSNLSDFFLVWLKRTLPNSSFGILEEGLAPKSEEAVQLAERNQKYAYKTRDFFHNQMAKALQQGRCVLNLLGIGVVVFAHKDTSSWETLLSAVLHAGWTVTASWPLDTEQAQRLRAQGAAALASSVHLVCRPRENPDGSLTENVGDWRDVLSELPKRIHDWMPRLAEEGVVGADAIFACLGPALEVFSRYSRVEKSSGEAVTLKEYLEHVWAAVSKEALSMIFKDPDTAGLEPDARLTAMWLWTLGASSSNASSDDSEDEESNEESGKAAKTSGFTLEFDAARKIAQGLGVHLEKASSVVEVKGDKAKLLSVAERVKYLFGKDAESNVMAPPPRKKKQPAQQSLFAELEAAESAAQNEWGDVKGPKPGTTVLDRLHQTMVLFAAGRGEAMKRFIVEEEIGNDARFWKLAQSLSALYPGGSDEKRWVDGVLARKKGLGF